MQLAKHSATIGRLGHPKKILSLPQKTQKHETDSPEIRKSAASFGVLRIESHTSCRERTGFKAHSESKEFRRLALAGPLPNSRARLPLGDAFKEVLCAASDVRWNR